MTDLRVSDNLLLECFADFYQEVARLKLAVREGNLALYLSGNRAETGDLSGAEFAAMVSLRLRNRLMAQAKTLRGAGTEAEIRAYRIAQYVMVALADELFILELDWPGGESWGNCLLERALFRTESAGRDFYLQLDRLLKSREHSALQQDLAAVFLIALQLGFKGRYRGGSHTKQLSAYRDKLLRFIGSGHHSQIRQVGFMQAYQYLLSDAQGQRLAPLSRWYLIGAIGAGLYLLVSSAVWLGLIHRFNTVFGG